MDDTNIESLIVRFGTEAILRYRLISDAESDSALPEIFLGGFIASRLYDELHCPIHIERPYTDMARELGIRLDSQLTKVLGGLRADLAIYKGKVPTHIVEFKIFDEGTQPIKVVSDLAKARKLASLKPVVAILGIMICEKRRSPLGSRLRQLEKEFGSPVCVGETQKSADGRWNWCFGSISSSREGIKPDS
jgi:hypothetical protein